MTFNELCESGANTTEKRAFLVNGDTAAITIRIPQNLKEAVSAEAALRGLSFSAYVRTCLMDTLLAEN
jgi:predicted DNA binding CopG/RHH family protein